MHKQTYACMLVLTLTLYTCKCNRISSILTLHVQVHYQLTPEAIQQIFAEKPHVHRAFLANVPAVMSEKEFWQKFFKNEISRQVSCPCYLQYETHPATAYLGSIETKSQQNERANSITVKVHVMSSTVLSCTWAGITAGWAGRLRAK